MFITAKSVSGNVGVSSISMEKAEEQLVMMDCNHCDNCKNCNNCNNCYNCDNCNHCNNCNEQPIQISGLKWIVTIRANETIKIGCEDHDRDYWVNVSDEEVVKMNFGALKFWREFKNMILSIHF